MSRKYSLWRAGCAVGAVVAAVSTLPPAASASENPLARDARSVRTKLTVKVAPGNWGSADPRDIQTFLEAVAGEFLSWVDAPGDEALRIRVVPRGGSPRVLYERGRDGEYVIQLTARNDAWFQYAYQFSHELCHIFSHFDHKERQGDEVASGNQWFEESLCETAALYSLKRLATAWAEEPPARQWAGYGPVLAAYAEFLQAQSHRRLPAAQTFDQWYRENQAALTASPYQREKNELVATALLPLFEQDPGRWRAIAYLNPETTSAAKDFGDFLGDWYAACPVEEREVVRQAMALFGITPPAVPLPRLARLAGGQRE